MEFIIITGLSGAGKTEAVRELEDLGYFCVDNMPPQLMKKFGEVCAQTNGNIEKLAFVIDIRVRHFFHVIEDTFDWLEKNAIKCKVLFLNCSDDVLIKRFKETRRLHPLSYDGKILSGIVRERVRLEFLRKRANVEIDTSNLKTREFKQKIREIMLGQYVEDDFIIQIVSFGFKYGIPIECDLTFDVRFIENPFYIKELKEFSGLDKQVSDFVLSKQQSKDFLNKTLDLIDFLIPNYIKEGKKQLVIGIGCTGGRHRSVAISNEIYLNFDKDKNYNVSIEHRDLNRDVYK